MPTQLTSNTPVFLTHVAATPAQTATLQTSDITSPPQSELNNDDGVTSPPTSRRRVHSPGGASSPGHPLFSSPPAFVPTSEIDLSSPLNFGTPSSRIGAPTPGQDQRTPRRHRSDIGGTQRMREVNLATDPVVSTQVQLRH